jgi:hypothetical protein
MRIKRLVLHGRLRLTLKARDEMIRDGLTLDQVIESIVNAPRIAKVLRSRRPRRQWPAEKRYVIKSQSYDGTFIYTKGKIVRRGRKETFYVLVSGKTATL